MKLVLIPPGEFLMGSTPAELEQYTKEGSQLKLDPHDNRQEEARQWYLGNLRREGPQHRVRITRPFYIGMYEVTQTEYESIVKNNPSHFSKNTIGKDTGRHPVEFLPWKYAMAFCAKLCEVRAEKEAGRRYRLPTEAEWEYACRGGTSSRHFFGEDKAKLGDYAWFAENAGIQTHPVGEKAPNPWGLYDMLGNVTEWCEDALNANFYARSPVDDPKAPVENVFHIFRGGCFWYPAPMCRSAYRQWRSGRGDVNGLRVVCTTPEMPQPRRDPDH